MSSYQKELDTFMQGLRKRNPHQPEFHQAVEDVASSVFPWYLDHKDYRKEEILERATEPDRIISFRVSWETDEGQIRADRAWRVQFNHALGPYKGGLRFAPTVNESILKFLAFEQVFKNSLTGLPMGGAKGGSNFNPKGKSEREVMRFCQSLMTELHRYIGEDVDIPAGDIGVGAREISYLFGQYLRMENRWSGVLTGKGSSFGGSAVREEATGYGCVYFCGHMLNQRQDQLEGKKILISGSGNVAVFAAEKAMQVGCRVLTLSDSDGFVFIKDGLQEEHLERVKKIKFGQRGRVSELAEQFEGIEFHAGKKPWAVKADIAMPCATQNELDEVDAAALIANNISVICEGANMPVTAGASELFRKAKVIHAPGKAANAGGVAVSGLELSQNAIRLSWSREEVDCRLREIMKDIHASSIEYCQCNSEGYIDYERGANIAAFRKVADAMHAYGAV